MLNIFSFNYLGRYPIRKAMRRFAANFDTQDKVLDIGCGNKPYAKYFSCRYIGLDPFPGTKADICAPAWEIPFGENEFDGVILNQSLEHILKTEQTINEIKRVLKPGGIGIITAPQTYRNHSNPIPSNQCKFNNFNTEAIRYWNNDFYRFTKFGLIYLFRDFEITELQETSGYFGTIFQLINYFFAFSKVLRIIFTPLFLINNIIGLFLDTSFSLLLKIKLPYFREADEILYRSLTLNYVLVIKKP